MTNFIIAAVISFVVNIFLIWYVVRLLQKLVFISENIAALFIVTKDFEIFAKSLYSMDSYSGEPLIQEMIYRIKGVTNEIEVFRDTFEYTLDDEEEEELYDYSQEAYETQEVD
jgi:hypothetical protein